MRLQDQINDAIQTELHKEDKSPFRQEGFDQYLRHLTDYTILLFRKSKYYADQQNLKVISDTHVIKAAESIYKATDSKLTNLLISLGGILLGTSLSTLSTLLSTGTTITIGYMTVTVITGILGAFLLGIYLVK